MGIDWWFSHDRWIAQRKYMSLIFTAPFAIFSHAHQCIIVSRVLASLLSIYFGKDFGGYMNRGHITLLIRQEHRKSRPVTGSVG